MLSQPELYPTFGLLFEANGLAAAGREPYKTLAVQLMQGWIEWLANSFDGTTEERRIEAQAAIALVDGLLLMRQLSGPAAADQAAVRLGISPQ